MKLTVASEYACLAMLSLAEAKDWCKRQQISDRYQIPLPYLEQILRKLNTAGIIVSRRGAEGGFRLAVPPAKIRIADIVRVIDGALAPVRSVSENYYQPSPLEASNAFHALFRSVRDAVAGILESTTLEDIVEQERLFARRRSTPRSRRRAGSTAFRAGSRIRS